MKIIFLIFILFNSVSYAQVGKINVSGNSKPEVAMLNRIFALVIRRSPTVAEKKQYLEDLGKYQSKTKVSYYKKLLAKVLASEAYYKEGFFNLQQERLLISHQGTKTFLQTSATDYNTLRMEMEDIARANNYWDILTFGDRWVRLSDLELYYACRQVVIDDSSAYYRDKCRDFLAAGFDPGIEHPSWDNTDITQRFSTIYYERCCQQPEEGDDFCRQLDIEYQKLFTQNFCAVAETKTESTPPEWDDQQLQTAISFYASLRLSQDQDFFTRAEILPDTLQRKGYRYYIKVELPEDLQGIHASPYWLSRHRSSQKNRHLHRARLIYHSWLCESVSPDDTNMSGGKPPMPEEFAPYFALDDVHAREAGSCFNCHRMVQPLANYFGKLTMGINYNDTGSYYSTPFRQRFYELDNPFDRPGGYYDEKNKKFFPFGNNDRGMKGLADLLQNLPKVHRCLVNSTWNGFFGYEWALGGKEVETIVSKFFKTELDYQALLTHLLTTEKSIKYFTEGAQSFYNIILKERQEQELTCTSVENNVYNITASDVIKNTCGACHSSHGKFMNADKEFAVTDNNYLITIYNRVTGLASPAMPQGGMYFNPSDPASFPTQKKLLTCFLEAKAKETGIDLVNDAAMSVADTESMHTVNGEEIQ